MTEAHWPRPNWRDSGTEAFLLWFVFGDFGSDFRVDAARYRTRGTPEGIQVVRYPNRELARWDGYPLAGMLGRVLYEEDAPLFERAKRAGECTMLRGSIADPRDLDGLRDLVGTITALAEGGGVAVVDPQILSMFDAAAWRQRYFEADRFVARDHVLVLASDESGHAGHQHVHSRGMRKFARPDLSIRNVPSEHAGAAGALVARFVDFQAVGGLVPDGHRVGIEGLLPDTAMRLLDEAAGAGFNNRCLELDWPA